MKNPFKLIGIASFMLAMATITVPAQDVVVSNPIPDNPFNVPFTNIPPGNALSAVAYTAKAIVVDFQNLQPFTSNSVYQLRAGAGLNTGSEKHIVVAASLTTQISEHLQFGIVGAHIGSEWYEGGANFNIGTTNLPYIGNFIGKTWTFVGDGPVWDFQKNQIANYSVAGFEKIWDLNGAIHLGIGLAIANTSDRTGLDIIPGVNGAVQPGKLFHIK
jgi:hypothetical protein